ncbi:hypothetical protein FRB99_001381 [Tulasnella sp. 403]|nr:hypothetical protein FRB99_001381 [Tulasnella sp. 403]
MSRERPPTPPEKDAKWKRWAMPEPQIPNNSGWNDIPVPHLDYGLDNPAPPPVLHGPFSAGLQTSNGRPRSYHDDSDAFWAFPIPQVTPPATNGDHLTVDSHYGSHGKLSPATYNFDDYDEDQRSVTSFSTAPSSQWQADKSDQLQFTQDEIERFQDGLLPELDEEWHRLTPEETRQLLPKKEVQRQSALFEVIKSERDYVVDLQLVEEIFIVPLIAPRGEPIIPDSEGLEVFVKEVFSTISEIEQIHERIVAGLFKRQKLEHPLISSISDIILEGALQFQQQYDTYIKNYPIAEARHRRELKTNERYAQFLQKCSRDTRIRKRDLLTLLSRPWTRLPRLSLMLGHILKQTPEGHPDLQSIPLIQSLLDQFVKATQPGIETSESKVKLRDLIENLVFERGEVIDLDLNNEQRSLIKQGRLARQGSGNWETDRHGWVDIAVTLLDNYLVMTRSEERAGINRHIMVSRPVPLEFLRLDSFTLPQEQRRKDGENKPLLRFWSDSEPVYPFMIHHAVVQSKRRYTLFAQSEAERRQWHEAFKQALGLRRAQQEANKLFVLEPISDEFFRSVTSLVPANSPHRRNSEYFTGKTTSAARFAIRGQKYIVIGCDLGVYMIYAGRTRSTRKVLTLSNPTAMAALDSVGQLFVLQDGALFAFRLENLLKAMDTNQPLGLSSGKRLDKDEGTVTILHVGQLCGRNLVCYAVKGFRSQTIVCLEARREDLAPVPSARSATSSSSNRMESIVYKRYGASFYVPRDATSITLLRRTIAVAADHSLVVVDPTLKGDDSRRVITVPDFTGNQGNAVALNALKARCQNATSLGLVWAGDTERLVIYDTFGTYVSKNGWPTRNTTYIRWETKATTWALRSPYVLLLSPGWVEVRHILTGRLEQVEELTDLRMLQVGEPDNGALLLAMRGKDDAQGLVDKVVEVLETQPIGESDMDDETARDLQWGEWDI